MRLASAQKATKMVNRLRGRNNECRKKPFTPRRRQNLLEAQEEGGVVVQIIHFPDTDSRTNTLDRASRQA